MKLTTLFCPTKIRHANASKSYAALSLTGIVLLGVQLIPTVASAQSKPAPPISGVLGKIKSVTASSLEVATPTGVVHVSIKQPLATYKQIPSDLSHIGASSYVGVPSAQQADGKELAKLVIIFPKELQGAAEGSVLLGAPHAASPSRMTNGTVARPAVSHSRMTNGTAQKGGSGVLVVRYQDGSQTIALPANVPVTQVVKAKVVLGVGDTIYAATQKLPNGMLTTNKVFQFIAASGN